MQERPVRSNLSLALIFFSALTILNPGFSFSEEIRYQSGGRRDPFLPIKSGSVQAVAQAAEVAIIVEGIIYDKKGASVIVVKGDAYKVGDIVEGRKVAVIYPSKVTFQDQDGKQNDYWISESEKQLSSK